MKALRRRATAHKAATYCIVTFIMTWTFWFAVVYPQAIPALEAGAPPLGTPAVMLAVGAGMFFPTLGVVVTRLVCGEGFRNAWIAPQNFKRTWKYYLFGWFGPMVLVAVGAMVFFLVFPADFDPSMQAFADAANAQIEQAGLPVSPSAEELRQVGFAQLALVLVAPLLNFVTCFGEEWGWRGYLLPHLLEKRSVAFSVVMSGLVWGLWHAPITILGHNYGLGYPGWPILGIAAMCCFCVVIASFFSWLTVRAKSCLPAVFAHGALNGCGNAPLMFMAAPANPFVGPAPTGVIGGIGFIAVGIACFIALRRHSRLE